MKGCSSLILLILLVLTESLLSIAEEEKLETGSPFGTLVHSENGPLQGIIKTSRNSSVQFVSFVGLRYANRPERFEPAQVLDSTWTTPKLANIPGSPCPQVGEDGEWVENEDCLFLNVYVPKWALEKDEKKKLPIMVWLHGGGYSFGDGYSYGAEYIMETDDVILVTLNYRLGVFGFMSMGTDPTFTSNNGLRDVVTALKWIQKNAHAFGGSGKVTVAGNSAGSSIVHYLLMSPLATGLFHGGIMQSGAFSFWAYSKNPRKDALQLATFLRCGDSENPKGIQNCLKEKSTKDLLIAQAAFSPRWPSSNQISRFLPTANEYQENAFFVSQPSSFFTFHGEATTYVNKVPLMAGTLRDEGSTIYTAFILSDDKQLKELDENWERLAAKAFGYDSYVSVGKLQWLAKRLRDYYFGKSPLTTDSVEFLTTLYSDSYFTLPVMHAIGDIAKGGMPVWPYVFTYLSDWSIRDGLGLAKMPGTIGHADELQYLLPHPILGRPLKPDSDSEKFSKNLVKFWTSFVKNGEPAAEWFTGEPLNWKPVTKSDTPQKDTKNAYSKFDVLRINSDPKVIKTFEFSDRIEFWRKSLKEAVEIKRDNERKHMEL